jgi:hypothetical protein
MTTQAQGMGQDLATAILQELEDDYVGAWDVARMAGASLGTEDPTEIREAALPVLEQMLMHGEIRAGVATADGGFDPWDEDPGHASFIVSERWNSLGRTPGLGEVAWFDSGPLGPSRAPHD